MLKALSALLTGASNRTEDRVRDAFAIELIDQKISGSNATLTAAKATLATLIQRHRSEDRIKTKLDQKIGNLTRRAGAALQANREGIAIEAAQQIATMESECEIRADVLTRLDARVLRLRATIEAGHQRLIDLRQGATQARGIRREQQIQSRFNPTKDEQSCTDEAEELIARVLGRDDPFEQSGILHEINAYLSGDTRTDRMAEMGSGRGPKRTAQDILARLKLPQTNALQQ